MKKAYSVAGLFLIACLTSPWIAGVVAENEVLPDAEAKAREKMELTLLFEKTVDIYLAGRADGKGAISGVTFQGTSTILGTKVLRFSDANGDVYIINPSQIAAIKVYKK